MSVTQYLHYMDKFLSHSYSPRTSLVLHYSMTKVSRRTSVSPVSMQHVEITQNKLTGLFTVTCNHFTMRKALQKQFLETTNGTGKGERALPVK